jgi:hypothetical protein
MMENLGKFPVLSGLAVVGSGVAGVCIYGLVLYDFSWLWSLIGIAVGIGTLLASAFTADRWATKEPQQDKDRAE